MKKILLSLAITVVIAGCGTTPPTPEEQIATLVSLYADLSCAQIMSPTPDLPPEQLAEIYEKYDFHSESAVAELRGALGDATLTTEFADRVKRQVNTQCITQAQ